MINEEKMKLGIISNPSV